MVKYIRLRWMISWLFFLLLSGLKAQVPSHKFGEISDWEWAMTQCDFDTAASAVMLLDLGTANFVNQSVHLHYHQRIKILDQNGYDAANIQLSYYREDNSEHITDIKAFTYIKNKDGSVTKIKVEDVFKEELNEYWAWKKFTFPSLQPGVIIEYSYTLVTDRVRTLKPWYFQGKYPVIHSEFNIGNMRSYSYNVVGSGEEFSKKYHGDSTIRNTWILERLPGYDLEEFVISPKDFVSRLRFQLLTYSQRSHNGNLQRDWQELSTFLLKKYKELIRKGGKNEAITQLISQEDSPNVKIKKIYEYLQKNYAWDGSNLLAPEPKVKKFLKEKVGSAADLNIYMLGMLRKAGVEAYPMLISTREHGKPILNFPLLRQFNKVVCAAVIGQDSLLLDLGHDDLYLPYNRPPIEDLNFYGFLLAEDNPHWQKIPPSLDNKVTKLITLNINKGIGRYKGRYTGYLAEEARSMLSEDEPILAASHIEGLVGQEVDIMEDEIKTKNEKELERAFEVDIPLELGEYDDDELLYFIPMSWTEYGQNPFRAKKRVLPIEFYYGKTIRHIINITPPDGYEVESLPESLALTLPQDAGNFVYSAKKDFQGGVLINFSFQIKIVFLNPIAYPYLREIYAQMSEKLGEAVIFKRK